MGLFSKKKSVVPDYCFDPANEKAIIRASICNGEQVRALRT